MCNHTKTYMQKSQRFGNNDKEGSYAETYCSDCHKKIEERLINRSSSKCNSHATLQELVALQ